MYQKKRYINENIADTQSQNSLFAKCKKENNVNLSQLHSVHVNIHASSELVDFLVLIHHSIKTERLLQNRI